MLAKTMSLGIIPLDICNHLFLESNNIENRLAVGASLPDESDIFSSETFQSPNGHEMEVHEHNGQGYYLIGTYFTYYTNGSKEKMIFAKTSKYDTGIYSEGFGEVNAIKYSFQSQEKTIMEGICWFEQSRAYGCLTGLFVNSQHLNELKGREIKVAQGGFLKGGEDIIKYSWGTINKPESCELAALFCGRYIYTQSDYVYLGYGSNKPALISHLWRENDLVFGNKENSQFTSRNVIGEKIQSWDSLEKYITYALSFS